MPEEDKFAPPPPNIVIRTMEKDIQALQQGGGELPTPQIPEELPVQPEDAFLQQTQPEPSQTTPVAPPPPPTVDLTPPPSTIPTPTTPEPTPETPTGKKSFFSQPLFLALLGIVGILTLGAVGYFVVFPIVQNALSPKEVGLPPAPSPIVQESPHQESPVIPPPSPIAPAITLAKQADEIVELEIASSSQSELFRALQKEISKTAATGTFKIINIKAGNQYLPSSEALQLLFDNPPISLTSGISTAYNIFLYWVNPAEAHLGVYFALNPVASEAASTALREWESTLDKDAARFFLERPTGKIKLEFRDGSYQNIPLRFAVFESGLAIDHAVIANTFVFTTHKDAMFEAIKRLAGVE